MAESLVPASHSMWAGASGNAHQMLGDVVNSIVHVVHACMASSESPEPTFVLQCSLVVCPCRIVSSVVHPHMQDLLWIGSSAQQQTQHSRCMCQSNSIIPTTVCLKTVIPYTPYMQGGHNLRPRAAEKYLAIIIRGLTRKKVHLHQKDKTPWPSQRCKNGSNAV
jgi:hypothetical protein